MNLVKRYSKDISWCIGSLFAHDGFVVDTLRVCKELNENPNIDYVFGGIPCVMHGGRIPPRDVNNMEDAFNIIDRYNKMGVSCRLTFSSMLLTDEDLSDSRSNELLERLNSNNKEYKVDNGVLVSMDGLAKYIKSNYKELTVISSLVKPSVEVGLGNDNVDYYNKLFETYDRVTVNPFYVNDIEFLRGLENHDKVDFIVNHRCLPNCQIAGEHYIVQLLLEKDVKNQDEDKLNEHIKELKRIQDYCYSVRKKYPLAGVSYSESEIDMLISEGFTNFRLEGRENDGKTFVRDMGDYIFGYNSFMRLSKAILEGTV